MSDVDVLTSGSSELTLQVRDLEALEHFYRGSSGLEVIEHGDAREHGADALSDDASGRSASS